MTHYRTVDTSTLAGLKEAERLHQAGWKTVRTGLFMVWFEQRDPQPTERGAA